MGKCLIGGLKLLLGFYIFFFLIWKVEIIVKWELLEKYILVDIKGFNCIRKRCEIYCNIRNI